MGKYLPLYILQGSHSDSVWLEDQRDCTYMLMKSADQHMLACRFDSGFGIFLSELSYLKPYLDVTPEARELARRLIQRKRLSTGGSYNQPAEVLISGEAFLRNILYGRYYHERVLGDKPEVYMSWDVFGHVTQLAQILIKTRFKGCIWSKPIYGARAVFFQQSLDGSRILVKRMPYGAGIPGEPTFVQAESIEDFVKIGHLATPEIRSIGLSSDLRLNAEDFKPPSSALIGRSATLSAHKDVPINIGGNVHTEWFRKTTAEIKKRNLDIPVLARDFEWYHQGTGVSRIDLKIANRICENTVINAEKFGTIAAYLGAKYPDKSLDKAWRQILFNQHHDAITGTSCDRATLDMFQQYRESLELSAEVLHNSLRYIADKINTRTRAGIPIVVFNSVNWVRTDVVRTTVRLKPPQKAFDIVDCKGEAVPFQVESTRELPQVVEYDVLFIARGVPSIGYSTYYVIPNAKSLSVLPVTKGNSIENEFYRVRVDESKGGAIVSVYDKEGGRELVPSANEPWNEIVILEEKPDRSEPSWEIFTTGTKYLSREYAASVQVKSGPAASQIAITGELKDCKQRYQSITLYKGVKRIDFQTRLDGYKGQHHLHVVSFPQNLHGLEPVFDDRFGCVVKRKSKGKFDFRFHQSKNYSGCAARRAYQWVDYSSSGKVVFDDGQAVSLGMVNIVLSGSAQVSAIAYDLGKKLFTKGIPSTPTYDDCDWERRKGLPYEDTLIPTPTNFDEDLKFGTSFRIVLDPSGTSLTNSYATKVLGKVGSSFREDFLARLAKRGNAVLFALDHDVPEGWPPLPVLLICALDNGRLKRTVQKLFGGVWKQNAVIPLPADCNASGQKLTVDDYSVAIINEGESLNSVENDGTMVLFLMHTAAWGYTPWGSDRLPFIFVPEWKSHNFYYSIYPHSGTWREGKTYRVGYEYNNPLNAVQTDSHKGDLKSNGSFLESDCDSLVLTALKPAQNPTAGFESKEVDVSKGIIARFYEAEGKHCDGKMKFLKTINGALSANLIDEMQHEVPVNKGSVETHVMPFSVDSLCFLPKEPKRKEKLVDLGRDREEAGVLHFKHWQHNAGDAPIGHSPVGISLSGNIEEKIHFSQGGVTIAEIHLGVTNNYVDRTISGRVTFKLPSEWRTVPDSVDYRIEPMGQLFTPLLITFGPWHGKRKGVIKARLRHDGQVYQDIIEIGEASLLTWSVGRDGKRILAEIENMNDDAIEGNVAMITSIEGWPSNEIGRYSMFELMPRERWFSLSGHEKRRFEFEIRCRNTDFVRSAWTHWIIAKLAYNGRVDYLAVPDTSVMPVRRRPEKE